jgi:inosose dehydratase
MTIRIANAPVSWGIYEFEGTDTKFTYEQCLQEIVDSGYTGIEFGPWGYLPTDATELQAVLDNYNLQLLSSFVPVALLDESTHEAGKEHALQVGRLLAACGAEVIVLADDNGTVPELVAQAGRRSGSKLSSDEWDVFAKGVNMIAQYLHDETGLKVVFHHHCGGYVETPDEVRNLMKRVNTDLVGLCLDNGHYHYGGGESVACIKEFGELVRYLHFKDFSPEIAKQCRAEELNYFDATAKGVFCPLGEGEVDFPKVVQEMEALRYDGWAIVEQDILTDDLAAPKKYATQNREYLRAIGL